MKPRKKKCVMVMLMLLLAMCQIMGGFELFLGILLVLLALFQFIHVWNRQGYVISFKELIVPIINIVIVLIMLLSTVAGK